MTQGEQGCLKCSVASLQSGQNIFCSFSEVKYCVWKLGYCLSSTLKNSSNTILTSTWNLWNICKFSLKILWDLSEWKLLQRSLQPQLTLLDLFVGIPVTTFWILSFYKASFKTISKREAVKKLFGCQSNLPLLLVPRTALWKNVLAWSLWGQRPDWQEGVK